ncbi:putative adaptor protein complex, sigma subunit [Dioscorea sansibarensis]
MQIHFVILISKQGKLRLTKWYSPYSAKERSRAIAELSGVILSRGPKLCNFVEWRGNKVVYRRYVSLYFCMCIDHDDNELEILEIIQHFVEILDRYFSGVCILCNGKHIKDAHNSSPKFFYYWLLFYAFQVCELDLIYNFHKAYYILDELVIAGELQESSKRVVTRLMDSLDLLVEESKEKANSIGNVIAQVTK